MPNNTSNNQSEENKKSISPEILHEILKTLISNLPKLEERKQKLVQKNPVLRKESIESLRLVPSEIVNKVICSEIAQKFGDQIENVEIFSRDTKTNVIYLNIRKSLEKTGIIAPISEGEFIKGLKVYRSIKDENPFQLSNDFQSKPPKTEESNKRKTKSNILLEICRNLKLFHTPANECFAEIEVGTHYENHNIKSKTFKLWISKLYYESEKQMPNSQIIGEIIENLRGRALFDSECIEIHLRVTSHAGNIYIDIGNSEWQAIKVTKEGWEIVESTNLPVKFRRTNGMLSLPIPQSEGDIKELRNFINVEEKDFVLVLAWLVNCFNPDSPFPVLALNGEHGSAKSTTTQFLRSLIDPNQSPLRGLSRTERDLAVSANNSYLLTFDNLSNIPMDISDALCRIATGGGLATRELYTDSDEILFNAKRPILINGIEELATRPDLLDRSIVINCPVIPENKRQTEIEFKKRFAEKRNVIFAGILTKVSLALRNLPLVNLERKPRMADFAYLGVAVFGQEFFDRYMGLRTEFDDIALEASPVGMLVLEFMQNRVKWEGTSSELLTELEYCAGERARNNKYFPRQPNHLSNSLRRIAPNLRNKGILISRGSGAKRRVYIIEKDKN